MSEKRLCAYGCGKEAKHQFKNGVRCCENLVCKCPAIREKVSLKNKERKHTEESKRKISSKRKGKPSNFKGKIHTKDSKRKMSKANINKPSKMKGKNHSEVSKHNMSIGQKRRFKNKTEKITISETLKKYYQNNKEAYIKCATTKRTLKMMLKKHSLFCKIEELREHPNTGEIQVHCKNHNCSNSKRKGGWFTPLGDQWSNRIGAIENPIGNEEMNFYCSEECKSSCRLYGKSAKQLIKEDQINAGHISEEQYTSAEYNTWRQEVLQRANYKCEYCGEKATHCHHIRPQKLEPFFSLDPDYGVACCKDCHYQFGHPTGTECSTGNLANTICN